MGIEKTGQWMISPKSFVKLLGAEYDLMQKAGSGILARFYIAALAIVIIFFLTIGSIGYAITLLFHDLMAEIVLSSFFSLLFVCIYIFLLNTFSKEPLPGSQALFSASNIIRTCFIVFIAYLVAQPLAIVVNGEKLEQQTSSYKQRVLTEHLQSIASFYTADLEKLKTRKKYCAFQDKQYGTDHFSAEINLIDQETAIISDKIERMQQEATRKVERSSFFLYRVRMGNHYPLTWGFTAFLIALFLLPGYLIYRISSDNAYYQLKKGYEKNMVEQGYLDFTERYKSLFKQHYGLEIVLFSRYADPPFKRERKAVPLPGTMDDFLKKYITAAE